MLARLGGLCCAVWLLALGSARAQVATDGFGIERFRLPMNSSGLLDVDWADVPGHMSWGAGLWVGYAHDPLVLYDRDMAQIDSLVSQRITTGLVGSLGLWNRLEVGLAADLVGYQAGTDTTPVMSSLPTVGLGDVRGQIKGVVLGEPGAHLHIALLAAVTVPAGSAHGYLREAGPTLAPAVAIGATFERIRVGGNLGYVVRKRVDDAGLIIDDEVFARVGAGYALGDRRDPTELAASVSLAAPASDAQKNQIALEALAGASRRVAEGASVFVAAGIGLDNGFGVPDWRALAGVRIDAVRGDRDGDGLVGAADRCPNEPEDKDGFADEDGCPDPDNDNDGIADARDQCPNEAEDRDGVEDDDGCPDLDNDHDGIADAQDKCPNQPEDKDGFADDDGCPDPSGKVTGKVVDPDGRPIPRTQLVVNYVDHPGTAPTEATSGDDGAFSIPVHGGAMKIAARAPEYQDGEATARVEPSGAVTISVKLLRKVRQGQLRGQVLSFDGQPLAANISVAGKTTAKVATDKDGYYTIDLPEGSFDVVIESPGHPTQRRKVTVKLDGVTVLNIDMRSGP